MPDAQSGVEPERVASDRVLDEHGMLAKQYTGYQELWDRRKVSVGTLNDLLTVNIAGRLLCAHVLLRERARVRRECAHLPREYRLSCGGTLLQNECNLTRNLHCIGDRRHWIRRCQAHCTRSTDVPHQIVGGNRPLTTVLSRAQRHRLRHNARVEYYARSIP